MKVSDEEHIAFITIWLSYYVFCPGSLQIAKSYISLVIQIHEGRQVSLGKLFPSFLVPLSGACNPKIEIPLFYSKGPEFVRPYVAVATLVEHYFRIPVGLSGVGAHNVFE